MVATEYTTKQLTDAEQVAATLSKIPEEKRPLVVMLTNSFIAGMEAQQAIDDNGHKKEG